MARQNAMEAAPVPILHAGAMNANMVDPLIRTEL
jgi:hypothetical protein